MRVAPVIPNAYTMLTQQKEYTAWRQCLAWIGFSFLWFIFLAGVYAITHPADERDSRVAPETEQNQA